MVADVLSYKVIWRRRLLQYDPVSNSIQAWKIGEDQKVIL